VGVVVGGGGRDGDGEGEDEDEERDSDDGVAGGEGREIQPWLLRWERVRAVVEGTLLLTGNVPVARTWERAASRSGMEMASAQSQSASPCLTGSLG
jgi:hypothetical protein